jgi:hypothetical protein
MPGGGRGLPGRETQDAFPAASRDGFTAAGKYLGTPDLSQSCAVIVAPPSRYISSAFQAYFRREMIEMQAKTVV